MFLASTSDLIQVITDASADVECHASWIDSLSGVMTPGRTNTADITTATTTTVVGSPAASTIRSLRNLTIRNNHASTTVVVDVIHTDGTNARELIRAVLLAGESLIFDKGGMWTHYDANAAPYITAGAAATQAEMEAAASTSAIVTPGRMRPTTRRNWLPRGPRSS